MAAEVGIAFLSASLQVLFHRLASPAVVNFIKGKKLNPKLVQRLKTTLYAVGAVLNDAENKQIKDDNVKNWLDDLKDAVYEADDFLDELSTKAATQSQKEVSYFSSFLDFQNRDDMTNKIADMIERLEEIAKQKDILGLKNVVGERFSWRPPSTSLPDISDVYGREKDKEAIINLLLSDERSDSKIGVIPIVGMGGIGKTTLAQSVYNDEIVRKNFDLFAWICVSEEFDVFNIIKTVLETIASGYCQIKHFNLLQLDLKEKLKGKKFLIILDDVWNESPTAWDPLMTPFYQGSEGSKLIVTTRSETVASIVQTVPFYPLPLLSNEDCWSVFKKHASPSKNPTVDSFLEKNHRDIINKCKGLLLAAKLLGGLLRSKPELKRWDIVLKSNIWDLSESEIKVVPALRISYHYLPPHLKRCFVHCSLFPKDYEFERDELILLWMAEDLLQPRDGNLTLEEVGKEYFDDLMSRSFFQHSNNQFTAGSFVIHDLIHDLATFFAGKFYGISKIDQENNITRETRHMSYNMLSDPTKLKSSVLEALGRAKALRTFLPIIPRWKSRASVENAPHMLQILLNLNCIRVLSVCKFQKFEMLPESICELIHLRYLDLSHTDIKILPEFLCKLHNLQTLKLQQCHNVTVLPSNIQDLVNLRFLDVSNTPLQEMPKGLGNCKNLHYLSDFIISKDQGARIEELGDLPNIGSRLCIKNLQYVSSGKEASLAKMLDKKGIESIELIWASNDHMLDSVIERDILDKLQPHSDLRNLLISGFRGTRCPDWLGLQDMTQITLIDCKNCYSLPPLGQLPSLKKLMIRGFDKMVSIETEFYNGNKSAFTTPFPSLEYLEFSFMPAWQEWCLFEMGAFPQLQELSLYYCPKLVGYLPKHLPALKSLLIRSCDSLCSFQIDAFLNLERLYVQKCENLESIVVSESVLQNVQSTIEDNPNLVSLSRAFPVPNLTDLLILVKNLKIEGCKKLEFSNQISQKSLKSLLISRSCDSLCSFSIDGFPNLEELTLIECENLQSIVVSESVLQNVQSITIDDNPNLVSLSRALPALNLNYLFILGCLNLKSLPRHMDKLFPNLKKLCIYGCPEIEWHGEGDMPPHLTHLIIDQSIFATFNKEWGLPNLSDLGIYGRYDNVQCFPTQGLLLPSSITTLWVGDLRTLEMLDCNGFLHLTSLKELRIENCPNLEKIAGERLPSSVELLRIIDCPLLEEQCHMKNAEIWPKISHVPTIEYYRF